MSDLVRKLTALYPFDTPQKNAEARALVCRDWIQRNPLPSVEQFDREMAELDFNT